VPGGLKGAGGALAGGRQNPKDAGNRRSKRSEPGAQQVGLTATVLTIAGLGIEGL
jgi:hypothetical protein